MGGWYVAKLSRTATARLWPGKGGAYVSTDIVWLGRSSSEPAFRASLSTVSGRRDQAGSGRRGVTRDFRCSSGGKLSLSRWERTVA